MDNLTEPKPEVIRHSLSFWVLQIAVKFNIVWYVCEVTFNLISDLRSPDESVTWQSIILATSRNWESFLNARIFMLAIGLIGAIVVWKVERYWASKND